MPHDIVAVNLKCLIRTKLGVTSTDFELFEIRIGVEQLLVI